MDTARRLRDRLVALDKSERAVLETANQTLPVMSNALQEIEAAIAVNLISLPQINDAITQLQNVHRALTEAAEAEQESLKVLGAGLGHLREGLDPLDANQREVAHLATVIQYFEIATQTSPGHWLDLLKLVELPVFAEAVAKYAKADPDRFKQMAEVWLDGS